MRSRLSFFSMALCLACLLLGVRPCPASPASPASPANPASPVEPGPPDMSDESATRACILLEGKEVIFLLPPGYAPAPEDWARAVRRLHQNAVAHLEIWVFTRPESEDRPRSPVRERRVGAYLAITHIPEPGQRSYTRKEFREVLKHFADTAGPGVLTFDQLKEQLQALPEKLEALAELQTGPTHSLWLSATDSEESLPQRRDVMLMAHMLLRKNTKAFLVHFFRFYTGPGDLEAILRDTESFTRNLEP